MTSSPDLINELKASKPAAPMSLRARVREIAAHETATTSTAWERLRSRFAMRRFSVVALPAAAALALVTAGAVGIARSDSPTIDALREPSTLDKTAPESAAPDTAVPPTTTLGATGTEQSAIAPTDDRAQRVSATLTVEVADSDGVSDAAQKALDLTRRLGGHVVNASVVTGDGANAALTVRVPVARVQDAIVQLSALGDIVTQQVTIDDLQQTLDSLERREQSLQAQITGLEARLRSDDLDAETRARLQARLQNLRTELRGIRRGISGTNTEARMATIQLTVVTPEASGGVAVPSRLDRTLDEALNVLVWEGVVALAIAIVAAPFVLVALAAWLGRRFYRRREEERLLAT